MANASDSEDDGDEGGLISGINVTPLVDITLVLLIIFMVTATYIVRQAIKVDLPRAANAGQAVGATLNIVLTSDGDTYVDGFRRNEREVRDEARKAAGRDHEARAVISADKNALHGAVVRVLDLIKGEGIFRFAINIEKEE